MRIRILGFDWDEENKAKVRAHDLDPEDVEWLFDSGDPDVFDRPRRPGRLIALGFVPDGRFVLVVFEYERDARWVRVITAHEAEHERWWRIYAKAKGIKD